MLNAIERRHRIVQLIEEVGKVNVSVLSDQFNVSTATIRGDLDKLDGESLIIRSHGGAIASYKMNKGLSIKLKPRNNEQYEKSIQNNQEENHRQVSISQLLAAEAARLINDGDSIILNSGEITEQIPSLLTNKTDLFVLTNGLCVASELAKLPHCEVHLTGGRLRKKSMAFCAVNTEKELSQLNFNKIILNTIYCKECFEYISSNEVFY